MKKKLDIKGLILDLQVKMERKKEEAQDARDVMYEAEGAAGEIQLLIWRLEGMLK